ncbi:MAG: hypothetical protein AVDCRST_MAG57-3220 [uncultured Blastococcus sp.]|uniref:Uncharacterized protein n=1 Tax=uncultured Blastococcus sp. TaxID=217144 RepID=A0A6J4J6A6_9ACTN|nr:MAG: hypothetical protein AVDCRST_MAG57-3220 [uncultured Blastococcus sp.]
MSEPTREQPKVEPTLSTAPSASRWRWSNIPSHVGPARTSTLALAVLWVAIFVLYLNVRPPVTPVPAGTGTEQPAVPPAPTQAPTVPETTVPETTVPEEEPTPTEEPLETTVPTETLPPEETTAPVPTSPSTPTSRSSSPTAVSPPG